MDCSASTVAWWPPLDSGRFPPSIRTIWDRAAGFLLEALAKKGASFHGFTCWMERTFNELVEEERRGRGSGENPHEGAVRGSRRSGGGRRRQVLGSARSVVSRPSTSLTDFDLLWSSSTRPGFQEDDLFLAGDDTSVLMRGKYPNLIQVGLLLRKDEWRAWKQEGVAAVAERLRRLDPVFADFRPAARFQRPSSRWPRSSARPGLGP